MSEFSCRLTQRGAEKLAAAIASGADVQLTELSVGDANDQAYVPDGTEVALSNECWRGGLVNGQVVNDVAEMQALIPADSGGYFIREAGIWDSDGELFAIANVPLRYKPNSTLAGTAEQVMITLLCRVGPSEAVVTFQLDDSVLYATPGYVDTKTQEVKVDLENQINIVVQAFTSALENMKRWRILDVSFNAGLSAGYDNINLPDGTEAIRIDLSAYIAPPPFAAMGTVWVNCQFRDYNGEVYLVTEQDVLSGGARQFKKMLTSTPSLTTTKQRGLSDPDNLSVVLEMNCMSGNGTLRLSTHYQLDSMPSQSTNELRDVLEMYGMFNSNGTMRTFNSPIETVSLSIFGPTTLWKIGHFWAYY